MIQPDRQLNLRIPLNIDQNNIEETQNVAAPKTDANKFDEARFNRVIADIQNGNLTIPEAQIALAELGINPIVTTKKHITIFSFEYNGKSYNINCVTSVQEEMFKKPDIVEIKDRDDLKNSQPIEPKVFDKEINLEAVKQKKVDKEINLEPIKPKDVENTPSFNPIDESEVFVKDNIVVKPGNPDDVRQPKAEINPDLVQNTKDNPFADYNPKKFPETAEDKVNQDESGLQAAVDKSKPRITENPIVEDNTSTTETPVSKNKEERLEDLLETLTNNPNIDADTLASFINDLSRDVSSQMLLKYIDTFRDFVTAYYQEVYGFDAEYINKAFDIINETIDKTGESYYLREVITDFIGDFALLTTEGNGEWYNDYSKSFSLSSPGNVTSKEVPYSIEGISATNLIIWLEKALKSEDTQQQLQAKMFLDVFESAGLDYNEIILLMNNLWKELAVQFGASPESVRNTNPKITLADMLKLDKNNDGSILYELYQIIKDNVQKTRHISDEELQATTMININEFFKDSTSLNAEYIESHLNEMLLSNDSSVRKFALLIQEAFDKNFCNTSVKRQDLIKWLLVFINEEVGLKNPNGNPTVTNISLTPEAISRLGDNVFDKLTDIINSQKLQNCYKINVDGVLDGFSQGQTNDCWFLAALIGLNSTSAGREIIKNAISWSSDYSYVTVKFANTTVKLTVEEILAALEKQDETGEYASGDRDALILELAYEKLGRSLDGTPTSKQWLGAIATLSPDKLIHQTQDVINLFANITGTYNKTAKGVDDLWALVTGGKVDLKDKDIKNFLQKLYDTSKTGKPFVATFGLFTDGKQTYSWTCVDGTKGSSSLTTTGHVFAITGITATTVTFVNPHDSSISYTVTWDEFMKIHVASVSASFF